MRAAGESVVAFVDYYLPQGEPAFAHFLSPSPGVRQSNVVYERRQIEASDARPNALAYTLSGDGFAFTTVASQPPLTKALVTAYSVELEALVCRMTGARVAIVVETLCRSWIPGAEDVADGSRPRQPVNRVHADFTRASAEALLRRRQPSDADELLSRRFAIVNAWRPLRGPVECMPLALCDPSSVDLADVAPFDLIFPDTVLQIYLASYRERHHWRYLPRMMPDEVILLKSFDSQPDVPPFVLHAALDVPSAAGTELARESIEARLLVLF